MVAVEGPLHPNPAERRWRRTQEAAQDVAEGLGAFAPAMEDMMDFD